MNTCNMYSELAIALGSSFDSLCEPVLSRLANMATLTKKIVASQTQQVMDTIVTNCNPQPRMYTNLLYVMLQDKAPNARMYSINHIKVFLETHGQRLVHAMDTSVLMETLEKSLKRGLSDSNPSAREAARSTFWVFDGLWHERGAALMASLDSSARKQLEKACPIPGKVTVATTPGVKKSSVAAAIAASRAKAKALATAPPALKHQATAPVQAIPLSPSPPQVVRAATSPKDGLYTIRRPSTRPMSPLSPPNRKTSSFSPSSSYSGFAPTGHTRAVSVSEAPPSPSAQHRRVVSSHLSPSPPRSVTDTLRKATLIALPPSPGASLDQTFTVPSTPPRKDRSRAASPTRIPSPTSSRFASGRSKDARSSFFALTQQRNANGVDESLLLAQTIPLPDDSDSEHDSQMMSFSAPFEKYHLSIPKTMETSLSTDSTPAGVSGPIVEDALRATAEQAESAAERLLELNEPDDESLVSPIPASLLPSNGNDTTPKASNVLKQRTNEPLPTTPMNKKALVYRQAASFKNSPVNKKSVSMVDALRERKHESGWWLKRVSRELYWTSSLLLVIYCKVVIDKGSPLKENDLDTQLSELKKCVSKLEDSTAGAAIMKKLALICADNPVDDRLDDVVSFSLPAGAHISKKIPRLNSQDSIWTKDKVFDRMFDALLDFLTPDKVRTGVLLTSQRICLTSASCRLRTYSSTGSSHSGKS